MWKTVFIVLVVLLAALWYRNSASPDVQLAAHLAPICDIAKANASTPERGVEALFTYLGESTPGMFRELGRLFVEIERISDDARHDERARLATRRIYAPLHACAADLDRFGEAIGQNDAAQRKLEHGAERFSRTLSILFGGEAADLHDPLRALLKQR